MIDTIKRKIRTAHRAQKEIEELNPDYLVERGADSKKWHDLEMELIELEEQLLEHDAAIHKLNVKPQHGGNRPGAGRKFAHGEPTTSVQIRMPNSLLAKIDNEATSKDISRNQMIIEALQASQDK